MEHQKGTWNEQISIQLAIQLRFNMLAFHIQEVTTVQSSIPLWLLWQLIKKKLLKCTVLLHEFEMYSGSLTF